MLFSYKPVNPPGVFFHFAVSYVNQKFNIFFGDHQLPLVGQWHF